MKINLKNFNPIWIFIIIVAIGSSVAIGWVVYDLQQDAKRSEQLKQATAGWKEQVNSEFYYQYRYPGESGWETYVNKTEVGTEAYANGQRLKSAGVNYIPCGIDCGLAFSVTVYVKDSTGDLRSSWAREQMKDKSNYKLVSENNVKQSGASGTRWEYQAESGEKIIFYYFNKDNYSYYITVNGAGTLPGMIDISEIGERIVSTIEFTK